MHHNPPFIDLLAPGFIEAVTATAGVLVEFANTSLAKQWQFDPTDTEDDCVPLSQAFTAACLAVGLKARSVRLHPASGADHWLHAITVVTIPTTIGEVDLAVDWTARQFDNVEGGCDWSLIPSPLFWIAFPDAACTYPLPFAHFATQTDLLPDELL